MDIMDLTIKALDAEPLWPEETKECVMCGAVFFTSAGECHACGAELMVIENAEVNQHDEELEDRRLRR